MVDYEVTGATAAAKYAIETDNYNPSAIGNEYTDGDADVPSYDTFEEGIQAIIKGIQSLFSSTDATKNEAKAKSVTLSTTPSTNTTTKTDNARIVALDEACKAQFEEVGCDIPIQPGDANANINAGQSIQRAIHTSWVNPDAAKTQQALMVTNGIGAEAAKRRNKGETKEQAVAAEFALGLATLAAGRNLNASGVLNLIVNAIGQIVSRSQNVTHSTKHPKPERSYVAQQNAQQQAQFAAALAIFTSLAGGARSKRISTPLTGPFRAATFGGMTGSFQNSQDIVYAYPNDDGIDEVAFAADPPAAVSNWKNPDA